jgi:hypothetical protein
MSLRGYLSADNNDDKDDRNSFRDFKNFVALKVRKRGDVRDQANTIRFGQFEQQMKEIEKEKALIVENNASEIQNLKYKDVLSKQEALNYERQIEKLTSELKDKDSYRNIHKQYAHPRFENKPVPIILQDVDNTNPGLSEFHSEKTLDTIRDFIRSEMDADDRYDKKEERKAAVNRLSNIFGDQHKLNSSNSYYSNTDMDHFMPSFIRLNDTQNLFDCEKVFQKNKCLRYQLLKIRNCGLYNYINQFKNYDLKNFSRSEFAQILHMNLPSDMQLELESLNIFPLECELSQYINGLNGVLNGGRQSYNDIENKFSNFESNAKDILHVFTEYSRILNNTPSSIISNSEKDKKIINKVIQYFPKHLISVLKERESNCNGSLSMFAFKEFLYNHSDELNKHLKFGYHKANRVKKVHNADDNQDIAPKSASLVNSSEPSQSTSYQEYLNQSTSKGSDLLNYDNYKNDKTCFDFEEFEGVLKVGDVKKPINFKKCGICHTYYHSDKECIFQPDNNLRKENISRVRVNYCLKCRQRAHKEEDCPVFVNINPVPKPCSACEGAGYYQFYHPVDACMRMNFLDSKKKAGDLT